MDKLHILIQKQIQLIYSKMNDAEIQKNYDLETFAKNPLDLEKAFGALQSQIEFKFYEKELDLLQDAKNEKENYSYYYNTTNKEIQDLERFLIEGNTFPHSSNQIENLKRVEEIKFMKNKLRYYKAFKKRLEQYKGSI